MSTAVSNFNGRERTFHRPCVNRLRPLAPHAEVWDEIVIDGDVMSKDCLLHFKRNGRVTAVASIYRDLESLEAEVMMERTLAGHETTDPS